MFLCPPQLNVVDSPGRLLYVQSSFIVMCYSFLTRNQNSLHLQVLFKAVLGRFIDYSHTAVLVLVADWLDLISKGK